MSERLRRATAGRPKDNFETPLVDFVGREWAELASDRKAWKALAHRVAGTRGMPWSPKHTAPYFPICHISNKITETTGGKLLQIPLKVVHRCDNRQVAEQCNGHWHVPVHSNWGNYVSRLRWNMHILHHHWKIVPALQDGRFFVHVARSYNASADHIANAVLDFGRDRIHLVDLDFCFNSNDVVVISSDGASRGNPGPSSAAGLVQVYRNNALQTVAFEGAFLGVSTSVHAEYESALIAQRLFTRLCLELGVCA